MERASLCICVRCGGFAKSLMGGPGPARCRVLGGGWCDEGFKLINTLRPSARAFRASRRRSASVKRSRVLRKRSFTARFSSCEILDHIKLMAVDPSCEHHKE